MNDTDFLVFEPWADPIVDRYGEHPEGTYSRLSWLPVVGPTSWLLWGTLATQLRTEPEACWQLDALATAHGVQRGAGRHGMINRTLDRLARYRLLVTVSEQHHLVRLSAPPVSRRQLDRLPRYVAELHHQTFAQHPRQPVG